MSGVCISSTTATSLRTSAQICNECVPGDLLVIGSETLYGHALLSQVPWSDDDTADTTVLPDGSLALVVQKLPIRSGFRSSDLLVLCNGRLGWICHCDVRGKARDCA